MTVSPSNIIGVGKADCLPEALASCRIFRLVGIIDIKNCPGLIGTYTVLF